MGHETKIVRDLYIIIVYTGLDTPDFEHVAVPRHAGLGVLLAGWPCMHQCLWSQLYTDTAKTVLIDSTVQAQA